MGFLGDIYKARGEAMTREGHVGRMTIIGDKSAYVSPMDRSVVEGRTAHKEHMRKHGVMEAGDMKLGEARTTERTPMGSVRSDINCSIQELSSR